MIMYVNLCRSCYDDWKFEGLVGDAIGVDGESERSECCHCGSVKQCVTAEYNGRFTLNVTQRQAKEISRNSFLKGRK